MVLSAEKLSTVEGQLSAAKDREKDINIAEAERHAAEANLRAASLENETVLLNEKLIKQGSRTSRLLGDNHERFVQSMKHFAGQKVEVAMNAMYLSEPDTQGLFTVLSAGLQRAGWHVQPELLDISGTGINICVLKEASPYTHEAADALASELNDLGLTGMHGGKLTASHNLNPSFLKPTQMPDGDTVLVLVTTHP